MKENVLYGYSRSHQPVGSPSRNFSGHVQIYLCVHVIDDFFPLVQVFKNLYWFSMVVTTNYQKHSGLKQYKFITV